MKAKFLLTAFTTATLTVSIVHSTPSTQIWIPSTDIQAFAKPHLGWDVYIGQEGSGLVSNGGITVGILPFEKIGLEIGIDYRDINGDHRNPIFFNAKLAVSENSFFQHMPSVAGGIYDLGFSDEATKYNIVYALVAKTFPFVGRLSVGAFKGAVGADPQLTFYQASDPTSTHENGLFLSWDRVISELTDNLWAAVDFQSGMSGYGALSAGISYKFAANTGVLFGYTIYNDRKALKPTFTVQFDIDAW